MKDTKTSLIFRMAKKKAPKAWLIEVDALLNHIDDLDRRLFEAHEIIDNLSADRQLLYKIIRNTANSLSDGDLDTLQGDVFRIVRQLDDLLMAARNDGVYDG